jgi:hypothetical protein
LCYCFPFFPTGFLQRFLKLLWFPEFGSKIHHPKLDLQALLLYPAMLLLEYHPRGLLVTGSELWLSLHSHDMGRQLELVGATNCFPQHMIDWAIISVLKLKMWVFQKGLDVFAV